MQKTQYVKEMFPARTVAQANKLRSL